MEKYYFIAVGLGLFAMFGRLAYSEGQKSKAMSEIIVACYEAGNENCHELWSKR